MKRKITQFVAALALFVSANAMAQTSTRTFVAQQPSVELSVQQNIKVTYFNGKLGDANAFCLNFENTAKTVQSFTFTLTDKSGKTIKTSDVITLKAGETLNFETNPALKHQCTYIIAQGVKAEDYTIVIHLN